MYIKVKVEADSKREKVVRIGDDRFEIQVREKAEHNEANGRVRELVARQLNVPIGKVTIITGHHAPNKILLVDIPDPALYNESIKPNQ